MQPTTVHVEKSIVINGTSAVITEEIESFQSFNAWSFRFNGNTMADNINLRNAIGKMDIKLNMEKQFKDRLKGTLIVPIGLAIILVPFSILIGWNLLTLLLFWFVLIPILTLYLPTKISKNKNHSFESLVGLLMFYGIIVFMIFDHYKTDYFQIMTVSCVINLVLVAAITLAKTPGTQTQ